MIKNKWYVVALSKQVKNHSLFGLTRFNEKLVLWRDKENKVHCFVDKCIHRGAALSLGEVKDNCIACPFHGLQFDTTGQVVLIPSAGKSAKISDKYKTNFYYAQEAHGYIWVYYGIEHNVKPESLELPFFEDLANEKSWATIDYVENWNTNYTRCIENQLDPIHLPFVHKKTIGRGNKTIVNGPQIIKFDEEKFHLRVYNTIDEGQKPLSEEEVGKIDFDFHLEFIFPNMWQNYIGKNYRITIMFVPVDENNTLLYMRIYHKYNFPFVKQIASWSSLFFSKKVLHEDRRVVLTQQPIKTFARMDERLIQGDKPIVLYRNVREKLLKENEIMKGEIK